MAKLLGQKFRLGAGLASASFIAGSTVAYCESDKGRPLFDPEALERGAKALKEINASPYAKKVKEFQHPNKYYCSTFLPVVERLHCYIIFITIPPIQRDLMFHQRRRAMHAVALAVKSVKASRTPDNVTCDCTV
jgi:hypothetical protein